MALPKTSDSSLPNVAGMAYVGEADTTDAITVASGSYFMESDKWQKVSKTTPLPVSAGGHGITTIIANESPRDTAIYSVVVDFSTYGDWDLLITNTTNSNLMISFATVSGFTVVVPDDSDTLRNYYPSSNLPNICHVVKPGVVFCPLSFFPLTNVDYPLLYKLFHGEMKLLYSYSTAPTSGMLSISMSGRN